MTHAARTLFQHHLNRNIQNQYHQFKEFERLIQMLQVQLKKINGIIRFANGNMQLQLAFQLLFRFKTKLI